MSVRLTPAEASRLLGARAAIVKLPKPSKYHAIRVEHRGRTFHSKAEARRLDALLTMGRAGLITDLELQPSFDLHVGMWKIGRYVGDFAYRENGVFIIEDVKGMATTPLSKWKQRHMMFEHGIPVREIRS